MSSFYIFTHYSHYDDVRLQTVCVCVCLWGHPDEEGQQDGQQGWAGGRSSEVEEQTWPHHRRRLGNTPTQQQLPHCLTELMKRECERR